MSGVMGMSCGSSTALGKLFGLSATAVLTVERGAYSSAGQSLEGLLGFLEADPGLPGTETEKGSMAKKPYPSKAAVLVERVFTAPCPGRHL